MNILLHNLQRTLLIFTLLFLLQACGGGSSVGGNEDKTAGTVSLTSLDTGGEIVGTVDITWTNTEANRSSVVIELSNDSGVTFESIEDQIIPDSGSYSFDTSTVFDCRTCRIRITATDVVGNVSDSAISSQDFIINNVPQVLGAALYYDNDNNGFDAGDTIVIPFDKPIELNASVAGDAFYVPVLGDEIGPFSTMKLGNKTNEVIITVNAVTGVDTNFHLHVAGSFDANDFKRTAPSGLDILDNLPGDIIFAKDTLYTAEPIGDGIDIAPTVTEFTVPGAGLPFASTVAVELTDLNDDGRLDYIMINTNGARSLYNGTGDSFTVQSLGSATNTSVTTGDIDGDDDIDLIVGNTNGTFIYTNNGTSTAAMTLSATLSDTNTQAVKLLDVDGDTDLDLVMATNGTNLVWENTGVNSGNFTNTSQTLGSFNSHDITYADIERDGDLDLIFANQSESNRVYINDGSGTFSDSGQTLGNNDSFSIAAGDVDADGLPDIVVANNSGQANLLYLNNGTGTFTATTQSLGNDLTVAIELIDFDGDNDLDIVTGNSAQPNQVWFNDKGTFSDSGQIIKAAGIVSITTDIAMGDIDQDGDLDMLEGKDNNITDVAWLNSSKDKVDFIDSSQRLGNNDTRSIAIGDLDDDGLLDIITANYDQANRIWFADKEIKFTDSNQELGANSSTAVVLGDIDLDGDLDAIVSNKNQANIVWQNNGNGVFTNIQELGTNNTEGLVIGDINNDGSLDLITANLGEINRVYLNNGSGVFSLDTRQTVLDGITNNTYAVAIGDMNGDTVPDLVTGNSGQPNKIFYNDGMGVFSDSTFSAGSSATTTRSLALADINDDGQLDVLSGNIGGNNEIYYGQGFVIPSLFGSFLTTGVALFDADNDGDIDIVEVNNGEANRLAIKQGNIATSNPIAGAETFNTTSMAVADLDGDGDLDFVTGNSGVQSNYIWLNDN